jgi:serine/threonine protein kinase
VVQVDGPSSSRSERSPGATPEKSRGSGMDLKSNTGIEPDTNTKLLIAEAPKGLWGKLKEGFSSRAGSPAGSRRTSLTDKHSPQQRSTDNLQAEADRDRFRADTIQPKKAKQSDADEFKQVAEQMWGPTPLGLSDEEKSDKFLQFKFEKGYSISRKDFEYLQTLGRGSFGIVCRVRHRGTGIHMAMKIINFKKASKHADMDAKQERNFLEQYHHPFLIHLYGSLYTSHHLYLVLQLARGGTLDVVKQHHKKNKGAIPAAQREAIARFYTSEMVLVLGFLHSHSILFRDLKLDNVLLDEEGHIRLSDLGISLKTSDKPVTRIIGAEGHKCPEMINEVPEGYGLAADWWQLGVCVFELLQGRHPFASNFLAKMASNMDTLVKKSTEKSIAKCKRKDVSAAFNDFFTSLLCPDPRKRLGGRGRDVEELKEHPFFSGLDWNDVLAKKSSPFPPDKILQLRDDEKPEFATPQEVINSFDMIDQAIAQLV